ncbi:MAG: mechanosensitive ion channel domain-containing protein [Rhodovibrionaceae bacterium]
MTRFIRQGSPALLALLLLAFAALTPAAAQGQLEEEKTRLEQLSLSLDTVEREFANTTPSSERLSFLEELLSEVKSDAQEVAETASQRLEPLNRQREALGEAPPQEEGQSESKEIASERSALNERVSEIKGVQQQAGVVIARSDQLLRRLNDFANQQTAERILLRGKSLLEPGNWQEALLQTAGLASDLAARPAAWWGNANPTKVGWAPYFWALGSGLLAFVLSWLLRRWLLRRYGRDPEVEEPSYARRVLAAAVLGLSQGLVRALAVLAFFFVLKRTGLITADIEPIAEGIVIAVVFALVVAQMARAALAPSAPQWGIVPLDRQTTQQLGRLTVLFAFVLASLIGIAFAAEIWTYEGQAFASLFALVSNSIAAVFLLRFLGSWLWRKHHNEQDGESENAVQQAGEEAEEAEGPEPLAFPWQLARLALCLMVLAIPATALLGYANLSHYIAGGLIFSAIAICAAAMTWAVFDEVVGNIFGGDGRSGHLRRRLSLPDSANALVFWLKLIAAIALACGTLLLLMLIWGVPQTTLTLWVGEFLDGVRIGEFTISPGDIFVAILVLVVALFVTRLLRRLLTERVLPRTRLDPGVRFSISAAASYAGVALAILLSISALGLDLSNLAIIAGALSVGIGFGLQNVVNNFVSGILLLIERPIKVGDWVIVGAYEGTVRRISVRSTEIETFDRSEVIVPNSDLISSPVVNWTHKTRTARLKVPVGVAYGSDTKQVHDILLGLAKEHEKVASYPEPYVLFRGFGDSSLDFELRVYVQDVDYFLSVPSDLYFAIDAAFREAKIEIPFPQRDLHIKDQPQSDKEAPTETPDAQEGTPPSKSAKDVPEGDAS